MLHSRNKLFKVKSNLININKILKCSIYISTETTPNPQSMKFIPKGILIHIVITIYINYVISIMIDITYAINFSAIIMLYIQKYHNK